MNRTVLRATCVALVVIVTCASRASAQTTALYLESQTGDYIGAGKVRTIGAADAAFTATSDAAGVHVSAIAPGYTFWWSLNFATPGGAPIATATYNDAVRSATSTQPGLDVYGEGRGCNAVTGRFVIREYVAGPNGGVARFAADFEQHCEDASPGLFGAIRYNSTITALLPFDGAYPDYRLTIVPSANGTVTATGIACGLTQTPCSRTYAAATDVVLTATADPGYAFAGWSGACASLPQQPAIHVNVNQPKQCQAAFTAGPAQITALYVQSETGDPVGRGETHTYGAADAIFSPTTTGSRVSVNLRAPDYAFSWFLDFSSPTGTTLSTGLYTDVTSIATAITPGLRVWGYVSCSRVTGRFLIRELVAGINGSVQRFAADFEQHCDDRDAALYGAIRYNSTVTTLSPFDGAYPDYRLTIVPSAHGAVTATGIDCGVQSDCSETYGAPATVALTATPDPDSAFLGWSGSCSGLAQTNVHVNGPKQCQALFAPLTDTSPWTTLAMDSQAGDPVGNGQRWLYSGANAAWAASWIDSTHRGVRVSLQDGLNYWSMYFAAPSASSLTPRTYLNAISYFSSGPRPGLSVAGYWSCGTLTGRFVVRELTTAADGSVGAFAVDFEQHCGDANPGLFGALRYRSSVRSLTPFDGAYPDYRLTIVHPDHGTVSGDGIACGGLQTACVRTFASPTTTTLSATADPGFTFLGWSGSCTGISPTTVHVNQPAVCAAVFDSTTAPAPRTVLYLQSQAGDTVGQGKEWLYNAANGPWAVSVSGYSSQIVRVSIADLVPWTLEFGGPAGALLTAGTYFSASASTTSFAPYMSVYSSYSPCGTQRGWFVVREIVFAADGSVSRLAIDFEQHCGGADPALFGALRYNSTVASFVPFDGQYPDYRLTIAPPAHGVVTGDGVSCGGGQTACERTVGVPTTLALSARPDAGYTFGGWSGDCSGGGNTSIKINGRKQCAASFVALMSTSARSIAMVGSQKGDYVGNGQAWIYTPANSLWSAIVWSSASGVRVTVNGLVQWSFAFDAPTGGRLGPGTFVDTKGYADASSAGVDISGDYRGCSSTGRFVVREFTVAANGSLASLAVDFEQHCTNSKPGLRGIIRYNSTVDLTNVIPPLTPLGVKVQ